MIKFKTLAIGGTSLVLMSLTLIGCQQAKDKNVTSFLPGPIIPVQNPTVETGGTNVGSSPVAAAQPTPGIPRPVSAPTIDPVVTPDAVPPIVAERPIPPPIPPADRLNVTVLPGRSYILTTVVFSEGIVLTPASVNLILANVSGGVPFDPPASGVFGAPNPPCNGTVNCNYLVDFQIQPLQGAVPGSAKASVINGQVFFQAQFNTSGIFDVQFRVEDSQGDFAVFSITIQVQRQDVTPTPTP
jgi:hypothetical protein